MGNRPLLGLQAIVASYQGKGAFLYGESPKLVYKYDPVTKYWRDVTPQSVEPTPNTWSRVLARWEAKHKP